MNQIGENELLRCKFVSDLFEYSTKKKDCSSKTFIKAFVYSSVQKRLALKSFAYESLDVPAAYEIIKGEKKMSRGKDIYPSFVMSWIGYVMQYFVCLSGIPMTAFYRKVKPEELYSLYEPYHSLDNEVVIKRICEAKKINLNLNDPNVMKSLMR